MLDSSEKLLNNGGNETISAGLYTYAVEEYGKLLFLKRYSPRKGLVKIKYKDEFRDHYEKFNIAVQNLPNECTKISRIGFEEGFENAFEHKDIAADFEARMAVFYSDFQDSGKELMLVPPIDKDKLRTAITKLRTIALAATIP